MSAGLSIVRGRRGCGWFVRHNASGLPVSPDVRLKRHAEQIRSELYATGADFTASPPEMRADRRKFAKAQAVAARWAKLTRACCVKGEHYSPYTYRNADGRCI